MTTNLGAFGNSTAISGDTLVVGDPSDWERGLGAGAVFVFRRSSSGPQEWLWTAKLHASDATHGMNFGRFLALDGNTLVVGSYLDSSVGVEEAGAAYVFERPDAGSDNWTESAKLTASDPFRAALFGQTVAISGATIAVGAPLAKPRDLRTGAVYVFEKANVAGSTSWRELQRLVPRIGKDFLGFGGRIALSGHTLAVGAPIDDAAIPWGGAVYVYGRQSGAWLLEAKLTAPDAAVNDGFGSVALCGNQLIVGAPGDDDQGPSSGSAYVFTKDLEGWHFTQKLLPVSGEGGAAFGSWLAAERDLLIVAAPQSNAQAANAGVAYTFRKLGDGSWVPSGALQPSELQPQDIMGRASLAEGIAVLELFTFPGGGRVHVFDTRLERSVTTYCEPSASGTDCVPTLQAVGNATASGTSTFQIRAGPVPGGLLGYFFYTHSANGLPVGNSAWTCLPGPTQGRSQLLSGGGSIGGCDGFLELDWNVVLAAASGQDPALGQPGTYVYGQFAYFEFGGRDRVQLTEAVAFVTCP